ncbi:MAG TPA: LpxL/LpxP family Kdo(2)-lipid IV(A) lauroyl/palmitoleoyl acyltransferase [Gammaproteobacteria bacterium]|nr:LpxL/LpxP family Kdo(2)-lipid IV(A) lauroyl/palmitoleoyl acyltransferase [Gammaproteobacteria bacterium]
MSHIKKTLALINPIYWPAWLGIGILWLITRLPIRCRLMLGKCIGRMIYAFPGKLKHITETNINLCFPELSIEARKKLAKDNFESLGIGVIEAAMGWWLPDDKLKHLFKVHGLEYVEQALARGKGIILLGPHFMCLEMVGRLLSTHYSFAVMYRPHKKRLIAFIQERFRQKHYMQIIPRNRIRELIRALNNNVAIWYAYDVDGGRKSSVFAPFFGVPTASLTSVSRLVKMSDAAIVPISFYRRDDNFNYDVVLYPPIENVPTGDLEKDATILNKALERAIREKPEQYVWQYKRFKTRPEGESRIY